MVTCNIGVCWRLLISGTYSSAFLFMATNLFFFHFYKFKFKIEQKSRTYKGTEDGGRPFGVGLPNKNFENL